MLATSCSSVLGFFFTGDSGTGARSGILPLYKSSICTSINTPWLRGAAACGASTGSTGSVVPSEESACAGTPSSRGPSDEFLARLGGLGGGARLGEGGNAFREGLDMPEGRFPFPFSSGIIVYITLASRDVSHQERSGKVP